MLHKHENQRDRIIAYLANRHKGGNDIHILSAQDQRKVDALLQMAAIIREHKVKSKCVDIYMGETGHKKSQAYSDFDEAQAILGSVSRVSKEFQRSLFVDCCWEIYAKAMAKGDLKSANGAMSNLQRALGFDKQDVNLPDYSRFQPPPQRFGWFPKEVARNLPPDKELIPLLKKLTGKQREITFMFENLAEDAEESE